MAYIHTVPPEEVTGELHDLYEQDLKYQGYVGTPAFTETSPTPVILPPVQHATFFVEAATCVDGGRRVTSV